MRKSFTSLSLFVLISLILSGSLVAQFNGFQVNVDQLGNDILLNAANEPSIAVDPNDPSRIAIGWRQFDTIASNFRHAGVAYSTNGGATWTTSVLDPGVFRSDPVLDFDAAGNFNGDSVNDAADFIAWNSNKFTASDLTAVPEPSASLATLMTLGNNRASQRGNRDIAGTGI